MFAAEPGEASARVSTVCRDDLPSDPVTVRVAYSSLNYKDGLALGGKGRVVRHFPMVCGIDLAGEVVESGDPRWQPGDQVIVTGCGLGEDHWGGYSELARVRPEWLVRMPQGRDALWAMSIGTAGFTAMLCVLALEAHGVTPDVAAELPVLVTGAAGGVGSVAVSVLGKLGYNVAAASGRPELAAYLHELGASQVIGRAELADSPGRALERERFCGAVDVVGSTTLAAALRQVRYGGCVAACGLAGGQDLPTTVHPFILRGVTLAGVDSVWAPMELRERAFDRLSTDLPPALIEDMTVVEPLERVPALGEQILAGQIHGRVVIDLTGQ